VFVILKVQSTHGAADTSNVQGAVCDYCNARGDVDKDWSWSAAPAYRNTRLQQSHICLIVLFDMNSVCDVCTLIEPILCQDPVKGVGQYPWPYRNAAGKAQGRVDSLCKSLIGKLWNLQQTRYNAPADSKSDFLKDLLSQPEKKDVFRLALQELIACKQSVRGTNGHPNYRFLTAAPAETQLHLKGPAIDLVPAHVRETLFGKSVQQIDIPRVILPHRSVSSPLLCVYPTRPSQVTLLCA
jgi:hypothetical protein